MTSVQIAVVVMCVSMVTVSDGQGDVRHWVCNDNSTDCCSCYMCNNGYSE